MSRSMDTYEVPVTTESDIPSSSDRAPQLVTMYSTLSSRCTGNTVQ